MIKEFKSYRKVFFAVLSFLTVFAVILAMSSSSTKPYSLKEEKGYNKSYYASSLAYSSQCGHIYTYEDYEDISFLVPEKYWEEIPSARDIVPMYGYIAREHLPKEQVGFYSPATVNRHWSESYILSTMWNLDIPVIWYDEAKTTSEDLERLERIANKFKNQILVLPWLKYEVDNLPVGRTFAFASMGSSQSCNKFNFEVMLYFLSFSTKHVNRNHAQVPQDGILEDGVLIELPIDKSTGK